MNSWHSLIHLFRCPCCSGSLQKDDFTSKLVCLSCSTAFPIISDRPVLLSPNNLLFPQNAYRLVKKVPPKSLISKFIPNPSVSLSSEKILSQMCDTLGARKNSRVLVVGCGVQRARLDALFSNTGVVLYYCDVDISSDAHLFCDAHELPFFSSSFDAVITTAVLEHVLYPEKVASEIARVCCPGGMLYSELPFMQQVHEGAYDFTRYTLSGHRRLFNAFQEIDSGLVAGPATALVWSIENFALAFVRRSAFRKLTKALVRVFLGWLKYFDHLLVNRPEAMDAASCTYFFGSKGEMLVSDLEIITKYVGAKHLTHT